MKLKNKAYVGVSECREPAAAHLAQILATKIYGTAIGSVERTYQLQQRGLSGAAGTDDAANLAFGNFNIYSIQSTDCTLFIMLFKSLTTMRELSFIFAEPPLYKLNK